MKDFPSSLYLSSDNPASHARISPIQPESPAPGPMPSRPSRWKHRVRSARVPFPLPLSYPFFCVLQHRISPLQLPDHRFPDASHSKSVKSTTTVLYGNFSSDNSYSYTVTTFSVLIVAYYSHILQFLLKYFILESISMLLFVPCANSGIGVHPPRCVTTRNTILGKRKIF